MKQTQEKHLAGRIHKAYCVADPEVAAHDAGVGEVRLVWSRIFDAVGTLRPWHPVVVIFAHRPRGTRFHDEEVVVVHEVAR